MKNARTSIAVRAPCVKVCQMDPVTQLCLGCSRTQEERDWWVAYTDSQQREVLQRCEQRRQVLATGEGEFAHGHRRVAPQSAYIVIWRTADPAS